MKVNYGEWFVSTSIFTSIFELFLLIKFISTFMTFITVFFDLVDSIFTSYQFLKFEVKAHSISVSVDYHLIRHATIIVVKR